MKRVFNFAMPFLQASLVKQILVGLVLGIALAYAAPAAAVSCGFLGTVFVTALKAVAPILVFVLVMSSIANQNLSGENLHIKPIIVLYLIGTFSAAIVAVVASFMFPTKLILTATDAVATTRRLAREEGICAGVSSGGAVFAALQIAEQTPGAVVVAIICDRGDRYLSSGLFAG